VAEDFFDEGVEVGDVRFGELVVCGCAFGVGCVGEDLADVGAEARLDGLVVGEEFDAPGDGRGRGVVPCEGEAEEFVGDGGTAVVRGSAFLFGNIALAEKDGVQGRGGVVVAGVDQLDGLVDLAADVLVLDGFGLLHERELAHHP